MDPDPTLAMLVFKKNTLIQFSG